MVAIENLRNLTSYLEHQVDHQLMFKGNKNLSTEVSLAIQDEIFQSIAEIANIEDILQLKVKRWVADYLNEQFARLAYIEQTIMGLGFQEQQPKITDELPY